MTVKQFFTTKKGAYDMLHLLILGLSLFLVISISLDTFRNIAFYKQPQFLKVQFWICMVFLADYVIELFMADDKKRYIWSHMIFLLVSIPYLDIIHHFGWTFSAEVTYLIRFIPLVRGGYALAIVVGWFTSNRTASLFVTYLLILIATVYFCAMAFYVVEHEVNPLVENFDDALWWAAMDTTTEGSNIVAVTPIGRILSFGLATLGIIMLPLFTVYLASMIKARNDIFSEAAITATTDDDSDSKPSSSGGSSASAASAAKKKDPHK